MSEQPPHDPTAPYGAPAPLPAPPAPPVPTAPPWGQTILPATDVIGAAPSRRPTRSGLVIGAIATVVAVTAGAGAYAAMQLRGGGRQPEALAPATSFAFAKLDLDPAAGQKLAVRELMTKFPDAPQGELEEVFDEFLRTALQDSDDVDYDRDIDPWLGDRIGIAGFAGPDGEPSVLGIIQSKDDDAARPALERLSAAADSESAYLLRDGYVLVAQDQTALDLATSELSDGALADSGEYGADVGALSSDQILTAWIDTERAFDAMATTLGDDADEIPDEVRERLKGRLALGVHAAADFVEVEGVSVGGSTDGLDGGFPTLLAGLPETTVAAISATGVGDQVDTALDTLGAYPMLPSREELAREVYSAIGLDLEADLLPLLGDEIAMVLGEVPDLSGEEVPDLALMSLVDDPARAAKVTVKIQDLAGQHGLPVHSAVVGRTFFVASDAKYVRTLSGDGAKLADTRRFRRAVGELGDDVAFVAYADLARLLTLAQDSDGYQNLRALSAVGIRVDVSEGRGHLRLRVVVE